jgi:hypothetical protein
MYGSYLKCIEEICQLLMIEALVIYLPEEL